MQQATLTQTVKRGWARGVASGFVAAGLAAISFCTPSATAQQRTTAQPPTVMPAAPVTVHPPLPKPLTQHRRAKGATPAASVTSVTAPQGMPQPTPQPAPLPPPNWPALAQPASATVHFNGSQLTVVAANGSLQAILHQIAQATGAKMTGYSGDQRIFGTYGPASAREVLSQLLEGSGFNVVMVGEQGSGTPRQVMMTAANARPAAASQPVPRPQPGADEDTADEVETDPQPVGQPGMPQGMPPGTPPGMVPQPGQNASTPQQILQQMQQRQQLLQQQPPPQQTPPPND